MDRSNDNRREHHTRPAVDDGTGVLGGTGLERALDAWAAEAAVDEAAAARARRHWLEVQARATATMAGVLLDLGERGQSVVLGVDEVRLRGPIVGIGADFVVLDRGAGTAAVVPLPAVATVRAADDAAVWGDRDVRLELTLASMLGPVADDRPAITAHTAGGPVRGTLQSAGDDVMRIRLDGGATVWIAIGAVRHLILH